MSEIQLSRPAKSAAGSLGHIEGVMSGWFVPPPPPPEIEELPAPEGPPPVGWETRVLSTLGDLKTSQSAEQLPTVVEPGQLDSTSTGAAERKAPSGGMEQQGRKFDSDSVFDRAAEDDEDDLDEALSDEALSEEEPVREYPFFSLGMALSVLLAFFATPFAATLFLITFLFAYGVRRWLLGVVPEVAGIRVLALVLGSLQILVAALLIARWSALGCVTLTPLPLIFLLGTQMVCSLLPRPLPFALTTLGFAAVLLQAYASWAPPTCSELRDVPPVERLTQQMQK
jgi:hypothetical protein